MEPLIRNVTEARELLVRVRSVADPLQRGDLPCDFTIEEVREAHANAALIVAFMTRELRTIRNAIDHRDAGVFCSACSYLRTLSAVLLDSEDVNEQEKMVLEFCIISTHFVATKIIQITPELIESINNIEPTELSNNQ